MRVEFLDCTPAVIGAGEFDVGGLSLENCAFRCALAVKKAFTAKVAKLSAKIEKRVEGYQLKMSSSRINISGKVVVVTGASMGIGEAIAKLFADEGAKIVLLSRDAGRAEAARGRIGHAENTLALSCDVRNREEIDRVVSLTLHHFQRIDIWINNAGHGLMDTVAHVDMTACRETFDTNFFGTVAGMQAALAVMRQQGSGAIINISSVAGHIPLPFHAVYSATKFAMNAFGKAANVELKGSGIHVTDRVPGIRENRFQRQRHQGKRSEDGAAVLGPRNQRRACRPRRASRIPEEEAGSGGALDHASGHQGLPVVSRPGGAHDGKNVAAGRIRLPVTYSSSASMASISDWAWPLPVFFAEAMPSASIFRASSVRSAFASVWAAMK